MAWRTAPVTRSAFIRDPDTQPAIRRNHLSKPILKHCPAFLKGLPLGHHFRPFDEPARISAPNGTCQSTRILTKSGPMYLVGSVV